MNTLKYGFVQKVEPCLTLAHGIAFFGFYVKLSWTRARLSLRDWLDVGFVQRNHAGFSLICDVCLVCVV